MKSNFQSVDEIPAISGAEKEIEKIINENRDKPVYLNKSGIDFSSINSACTIALHMHQPMIPAGDGKPITEAKIISNLEHMFNNPDLVRI